MNEEFAKMRQEFNQLNKRLYMVEFGDIGTEEYTEDLNIDA